MTPIIIQSRSVRLHTLHPAPSPFRWDTGNRNYRSSRSRNPINGVEHRDDHTTPFMGFRNASPVFQCRERAPDVQLAALIQVVICEEHYLEAHEIIRRFGGESWRDHS